MASSHQPTAEGTKMDLTKSGDSEKTTTATAVTTEGGIDYDQIMKDLESAEDNVIRILEIATTTTTLLQDAPLCDHKALTHLSTEYSELLLGAYHKIEKHLDIFEKEPLQLTNHTYEKEIQQLEALAQRLDE